MTFDCDYCLPNSLFATDSCFSAQVTTFVEGMLTLNTTYDKFRLHLRDFFVSLKEFVGDNAELFQEEKEQQEREAKLAEKERRQKVGGLLKPSELEDEEL